MARESCSPKMKQDASLETIHHRIEKKLNASESNADVDQSSSKTQAADTPRTLSQSTPKSTPSSKKRANSQSSRSPNSTASTAATSWSSHHHPDPRSPPMNTNPPPVTYQTQFAPANGGAAYAYDVASSRLVHIGAQFYKVVDGGPQTVTDQSMWQGGLRYQTVSQTVAYNTAPIDLYQQQTIYDEPYGYGYTNAGDGSSAGAWDGSPSTADLL